MRLPRRSPACVLGTLLACSVVFLLVQLNLLQSGTQEEDMVQSLHRIQPKKTNYQYEAISKFSRLLLQYRVSGFLIDPKILESVLQFKGSKPLLDSYCLFLCGNSTLTNYGVISHADVSKKFLNAAKEEGFHHFEVTGLDPRVLQMKIVKEYHIPYHHIFLFDGHVIQLVVFYMRSDAFLWHGRIDWSQIDAQTGVYLKEQCKGGDILFGKSREGAYDKMEFAEIKVDGVNFMVPKYPKKFLSQIPHSKFLECNYQAAAKFLSQYNEKEEEEGEIFRFGAKDLLISGAAVLDELGIPFWLSSGTCLSWFRECRIIGHSLDVDFGMKIEDYSVRIIPAMEIAGLMLVHQFGKKSDSFELSFVKDKLKLDIFFFYEEGNTLWNGGTDTSTGDKFKYIFPWFDLCWTEFVGIKVRVPCQTQSYIEANYGKSWNKKVTSWTWNKSPPNVRPNGRWPKEEWSDVMQVFEIIEVDDI